MQRQVQPQHVHARLAEEAQRPALGVLVHELLHGLLGQAPLAPTASIFVKMKPGFALDKDRALTMASFVSRAVAGLDVTNIVVTDAATGRPFTAPKPGSAVALDDLEARQKMEEHFANKIKQLFGNIPGLLVAVHADLVEEPLALLA